MTDLPKLFIKILRKEHLCMESSLDLRVQKTYDALITALLELTKEKIPR
ncbi:hypothetical protein YG2_22520 [Tetragenococcus halophilus]|nr:hypothetical protein YG2_22520 [Tetragenococcus halophilus]